MASKQADAKIDNNTQSTKIKIRKFLNGDYKVDTSSLNKACRDLGRMFSMQDKGGSRYSVLRTPNRSTITIRLSDHLANGSNFKRVNTDTNLSIVIERHVYETQGESDVGIKFRLLDANDPKTIELESLPESELIPVYRNVLW